MSEAVRDIPLARYREEIAPLAVTAVPVAPGGPTVDVVAFERVVMAVPLFFPITTDLRAFRDAFGIPGFYLDSYYDPLFDPGFAAGLASRIAALNAAPPATIPTFVLGGSSNHFHRLLDFLPRLALLAHDPAWSSAVVVTDDSNAATMQEGIELIRAAYGLPPPNLRALPEGVVGLRRALVPASIPRRAAVAIWRHVAAHHLGPVRATRRLFARRGAIGRRRLLNEDAVAERLARVGFTDVVPGAMSLAAQMRLFAEASIIVGTHGAALANAAFMPAGGSMVEIVGEGLASPFPGIAKAAGLRFGRLGVPVAGATPEERLNADLTLPETGIETLLRGLPA